MGLNDIEIANALQTFYYFESLTLDQLKAISSIVQTHQYDAGESVFSEGQKALSFYLVLSGQVQVYKISKEGKEIVLHLVGPGESFAEFPFFTEMETYPANAICLQPSLILAINGATFREVARQNPDIMFRITAQLAKRLKEFNEFIEDLSLRNVDSRVAKYLLSISENSPEKAVVRVHKKTLAAIVGTVPETLSRCFKRMSGDHLIEVHEHHIKILDRSALKTMASID